MFHLSIWGAWNVIWEHKTTKAPGGDGTDYATDNVEVVTEIAEWIWSSSICIAVMPRVVGLTISSVGSSIVTTSPDLFRHRYHIQEFSSSSLQIRETMVVFPKPFSRGVQLMARGPKSGLGTEVL